MVIIILQYIHLSNHYVVHFGLKQCYVNYTINWEEFYIAIVKVLSDFNGLGMEKDFLNIT